MSACRFTVFFCGYGYAIRPPTPPPKKNSKTTSKHRNMVEYISGGSRGGVGFVCIIHCLLSYFQILICNELSVFFHFLLAPEEGLLANIGQFFKIYDFCFIFLFTSSSPCRKDRFAVSYFSTSLIVLIQVYNWETRHHSLVCCCGLADIIYILGEERAATSRLSSLADFFHFFFPPMRSQVPG